MTVSPEVLEEYDVVGAPQDEDLAAIARLAARICRVPTATVNLLDTTSQHSVATFGYERSSIPVAQSICQTTVGLSQPLYVSDLRDDERFSDHPQVNGQLGSIVFYGGTQLREADGTAIGTLCVFDSEQHELDEGQRAALDDLASQAMQVLQLRAETRRLQTSNEELSRSNADLAAFTGRIAHDLRNPLSATRGFLQLALSRFGDDLTGRARECVVHAETATLRMAQLVDDLLSFAAAGATARHEPVELATVVGDVTIDLRTLVESTGGRIEIGDLPSIESDPTLLRQLLQNVVSNGLKYARPDVPPVVTISGSADDGRWSIAVADNGRGIPVEERASVFELFTRLPGGRDVPGSGIGMATCARIAEGLGARISLDDTPGGGTTVTIST